jgi:conjugative transposon TraN protein
MKQIFLMLAIVASAISVSAQEDVREDVRDMPSTGDLFEGFTRPLTFNRMIPPYALEVTFTKTVHIIFPAAVRYVDLGSIDLLAAKADGAENVLRVKAATQRFRKESNLSVITEDGSYYTFNVKYADEPVKLSVEMADFLHAGYETNRPGNELPVFLSDLGSESPYMVRLIMETVHKNNRTKIKHIGSRNFGIQYLLKGIYSHNELLFFHLQLKNTSTVSFNVDYLTFRIVDKKVAKRTAMQEQVIIPLRSYNQMVTVAGGKEERTVFCLPKFTIPNDKQLVIELMEKDGGRNQTLTVENSDLIRAEVIDNLTVKVK